MQRLFDFVFIRSNFHNRIVTLYQLSHYSTKIKESVDLYKLKRTFLGIFIIFNSFDIDICQK